MALADLLRAAVAPDKDDSRKNDNNSAMPLSSAILRTGKTLNPLSPVRLAPCGSHAGTRRLSHGGAIARHEGCYSLSVRMGHADEQTCRIQFCPGQTRQAITGPGLGRHADRTTHQPTGRPGNRAAIGCANSRPAFAQGLLRAKTDRRPAHGARHGLCRRSYRAQFHRGRSR